MKKIVRSIRSKLIVVFLGIALFPLAIMTLLYVNNASKILYESSALTLERGAQLVARDLDDFINYNIRNIWSQAQLSEFSQFIQSSEKERNRLETRLSVLVKTLQRVDSSYLHGFYLMDGKGQVIFDSSTRMLEKDCSDCENFKKPFSTGLPQIHILKNDQGNWSLHFTTPVRDNLEKLVGVFGVSFGVTILQRMISKYIGASGEKSFAVILDEKNRRLAYGNLPEYFYTPHPPFHKEVNEKLASVLVDGEKFFVSEARISNYSWKVQILQPQNVFDVYIYQRLYFISAVSLVIIAISLALFFYTESWISNPIRQLSQTIKAIVSGGDLRKRVKYFGKDEIGVLAAEFNIMIDKIEYQLLEISDKEKSFRTLFESSPDPCWVLKNGVFVDCNSSALVIMKANFKEDLIQKSPLDFSPEYQPDGRLTSEAVGFYIQRAVSEGKTRFEWLHRRLDGTYFMVEVHLAALDLHVDQVLYCTWRDIEERKKAEREKELILKELEAKNKEMESIVYVSSHDLRSPLVNVLGFSQRLEKVTLEIGSKLNTATDLEILKADVAPLLSDRIPSMVRFIQTSGKKMDTLINGLLKLSRTGRVPLVIETIDMNKMIEAIVEAHKFMLEKIGAHVVVGDFPPCEGDMNQINQIFSNLVDNAIKYADPTRKLCLTLEGSKEGDKVVYKVRDTGKGIPLDHQDKIWNLFHRLEPQGEVPGEGLGLTLTHKITERHGGRIWVESEQGVGSCFFVELPTAKT